MRWFTCLLKAHEKPFTVYCADCAKGIPYHGAHADLDQPFKYFCGACAFKRESAN